MTQKVVIERAGDFIRVEAPFNSFFVAEARPLGGRWHAPAWLFDARNEKWVRDLAYRIYGQDGVRKNLCTIRLEWVEDWWNTCGPLSLHGRTLARATGRDSGATVGDGVMLLQGRVKSGGSLKNWQTQITEGSVMIVRDFPREIAEQCIGETDRGFVCTIEEEPAAAQSPSKADLDSERKRLMERVAEIDAALLAAA